MWSPIIRLIDILTTDQDWRAIRRRIPSPLGLKALDIAWTEIAVDAKEIGGNNRGLFVEKYGGGGGPLRSWCAKFIFWLFLSASLAGGRTCPIKRTHGARRLFRRAVAAGWLVDLDDIQPGDIVLWDRGPNGSWKAHIGIVSRVERDEDGNVVSWFYIAGNEGDFPAPVHEVEGTNRGRRVGFARVW